MLCFTFLTLFILIHSDLIFNVVLKNRNNSYIIQILSNYIGLFVFQGPPIILVSLGVKTVFLKFHCKYYIAENIREQ